MDPKVAGVDIPEDENLDKQQLTAEEKAKKTRALTEMYSNKKSIRKVYFFSDFFTRDKICLWHIVRKICSLSQILHSIAKSGVKLAIVSRPSWLHLR